MNIFNDLKRSKLFHLPHTVSLFLIVLAFVYFFYCRFTNAGVIPTAISLVFLGYAIALIWMYIDKALTAMPKEIHWRYYVNQIITHDEVRTKLTLLGTTGINMLFGLFYLWIGFENKSTWFLGIGGYHIILFTIRYQILRQTVYQQRDDIQIYRSTGAWIMILNIFIAIISIEMIYRNQSFAYAPISLFLLTLYTIYRVLYSANNVIHYSRTDDWLSSAVNNLNLIAAIVAAYTLETAYLFMFVEEENAPVRQAALTLTGLIVFFLCLAISSNMIIRANRALKEAQDTPTESTMIDISAE